MGHRLACLFAGMSTGSWKIDLSFAVNLMSELGVCAWKFCIAVAWSWGRMPSATHDGSIVDAITVAGREAGVFASSLLSSFSQVGFKFLFFLLRLLYCISILHWWSFNCSFFIRDREQSSLGRYGRRCDWCLLAGEDLRLDDCLLPALALEPAPLRLLRGLCCRHTTLYGNQVCTNKDLDGTRGCWISLCAQAV